MASAAGILPRSCRAHLHAQRDIGQNEQRSKATSDFGAHATRLLRRYVSLVINNINEERNRKSMSNIGNTSDNVNIVCNAQPCAATVPTIVGH